jgi:hypothetical protein
MARGLGNPAASVYTCPVILRALILFLALATPADAETRFLAAFDDVPLAPALEEQGDAAFAFGTPQGRIADALAVGAADEAGVRAWYAAALPALGWSMEADSPAAMAFVRGRERLTLSFSRGSDGALAVRYRMVAHPASLALD